MSKAAAACACLVLLLSGDPAEAQGAAKAPREEAADTWILSETHSPLDYAPVIIASAWSYGDGESRGMQLSIQCRRGRTDVVIVSPGLAGRRPDEARISYAVDGAAPTVLPAGPAASGTGIALKGDVVRLLAMLPARGEVVFKVVAPDAPLEGHYDLSALNVVLKRLAGPCKWPARTP